MLAIQLYVSFAKEPYKRDYILRAHVNYAHVHRVHLGTSEDGVYLLHLVHLVILDAQMYIY